MNDKESIELIKNSESEHQLRQNVKEVLFSKYKCKTEVDNIDFRVSKITEKSTNPENYMWAESKLNPKASIYESLVQLIITIKSHKLDQKELLPIFLGAFDTEKIVFLPCHLIADYFYLPNFNWNIPPSDHKTKGFKLLLSKLEKEHKDKIDTRKFEDIKALKEFIADNFKIDLNSIVKPQINAENFTYIYQQWMQEVMPSIEIKWDKAYLNDILPADFFLADILSRNNKSLYKNLFVLLEQTKYEYDEKPTLWGNSTGYAGFKDNQVAHKTFWKRYKRPPKKIFWDEIIQRRDLLVPEEMRKRKGAFFTPPQWVKLSQKYLAKVLGKNWQDEYYIWDCAGGTGNLMAGLKNKNNIFVSTLDIQDVKVMYQRIYSKQLNLWPSQVFQFDFLNDSFDELPQNLKKIIDDPEMRKKLVIYINPPYAEVASMGIGGKKGVNVSKIHEDYKSALKGAGRELFSQFLIRIYKEIPGCIIADFSTLKGLLGASFHAFREIFKPKLCSIFICPAFTFDNVDGKFPIGFKIWDSSKTELFNRITARVYNKNDKCIGTKKILAVHPDEVINKWISKYKLNEDNGIGFLCGTNGNDFQQNKIVYILNHKKQMKNPRGIWIDETNIIQCSIYYAVRHSIERTWLNDRDQFLYPKDTWKDDFEFHSDCLAYTLFHMQNNVTATKGTNHWIPFTEEDVGAKDKFESHFMVDYINGGMISSNILGKELSLFAGNKEVTHITFSKEAKAVMDAGKELWSYYHSKPRTNLNASYKDIREYFRDVNDKKMNSKNADNEYIKLRDKLSDCINILTQKIKPKIYEHGFLRKTEDVKAP